jgi:hypothetical protein
MADRYINRGSRNGDGVNDSAIIKLRVKSDAAPAESLFGTATTLAHGRPALGGWRFH